MPKKRGDSMANNSYGVRDDVWGNLTPEERSSVASGNQTTIGYLGSAYSGNSSSGSSGSSPSGGGYSTQGSSSPLITADTLRNLYNRGNDGLYVYDQNGQGSTYYLSSIFGEGRTPSQSQLDYLTSLANQGGYGLYTRQGQGDNEKLGMNYYSPNGQVLTSQNPWTQGQIRDAYSQANNDPAKLAQLSQQFTSAYTQANPNFFDNIRSNILGSYAQNPQGSGQNSGGNFSTMGYMEGVIPLTSGTKPKAYYASDVDKQSAIDRGLINFYDLVPYSPNTAIGQGNIALGGSAVIPDSVLSGGTRLGGADRNSTADLIGKYVDNQWQNQYSNYLTNYYNQVAQAEAESKRNALLNAYQQNQQALNSQNATVGNSYQSLVNNLTASRDAQLPVYQDQRDATSAEAAAQLRRTQALNALTGKFHSGANRSQQLAVDLAKQNAMQKIGQAENQFTTGITNKLSDADAQRVAALNDIAEKMALNSQQYNQGTLSLNNQLASTQAANANKAFAEAMDWLNTTKQNEATANYRERQLALDEMIAKANQDYNNAKLAQDDSQFWAGLNLKGNSGGSGFNSSQQNYIDKQNAKAETSRAMDYIIKLASGNAYDDSGNRLRRGTASDIQNWIKQNAAYLNSVGVDVNWLTEWAADNYSWEPAEGTVWDEKTRTWK